MSGCQTLPAGRGVPEGAQFQIDVAGRLLFLVRCAWHRPAGLFVPPRRLHGFRWPRVGDASPETPWELWRIRWNRKSPKDHAGLKIVIKTWRDTPDEKYKLTLVFVLVPQVWPGAVRTGAAASRLFTGAFQVHRCAFRGRIGVAVF